MVSGFDAVPLRATWEDESIEMHDIFMICYLSVENQSVTFDKWLLYCPFQVEMKVVHVAISNRIVGLGSITKVLQILQINILDSHPISKISHCALAKHFVFLPSGLLDAGHTTLGPWPLKLSKVPNSKGSSEECCRCRRNGQKKVVKSANWASVAFGPEGLRQICLKSCKCTGGIVAEDNLLIDKRKETDRGCGAILLVILDKVFDGRGRDFAYTGKLVLWRRRVGATELRSNESEVGVLRVIGSDANECRARVHAEARHDGVRGTHVLVTQSCRIWEAENVETVVDGNHNVVLRSLNPLTGNLIGDVLTSSNESTSVDPDEDRKQLIALARLAAVTGWGPDAQNQTRGSGQRKLQG
ncbi:acetylcholinesterase, partial [Aureobasidium melanogenum]